MRTNVVVIGNQLSIKESLSLTNQDTQIKVNETNWEKIDKCVAYLEKIISNETPVYGVSTGFGHLQNTWIGIDDQKQLQINLIRSHAAGTGNPVPPEITRTAMILLANSLSKGYSGIRKNTLKLLIKLINQNLIPVTYTLGSLGASGDLAPLAHIALALLAEGKIWKNGLQVDSDEIFDQYNLSPITLEAKEGLALINGTHFMTAYALHILKRSHSLISHSLIASSLSIEALRGTNTPFSDLIANVRPFFGHRIIAKALNQLLEGSQILQLHKDPKVDHKIQDAYVLRCIPQVLGAIWDSFGYLEKILSVEINSITDNPLIFYEEKQVLSGGNFHGEPIALPIELVTMALVELANITERRISRLVSPFQDELNPFLANKPGIESGYMIAHYTVAALINRIRVLSHPAVVDNIPVSGGQEDHVSMGMNSAIKAFEVTKIVEEIVANELFMAIRGLNQTKKERSSPFLEEVITYFNGEIIHKESDHIIRDNIQSSLELLRTRKLLDIVKNKVDIPAQFQERSSDIN
ncbi:MAG: histidine ammonia-lyase [Candidatus Kariarchaeaceae archaeon]|jgi:histidine ammonia-lyase